MVRIRMIVEYPISVPRSWDVHMIEFHRNDSSWCSDNALSELNDLIKNGDHCLCAYTSFRYIEEENDPFHGRHGGANDQEPFV